MTNLNYGVSVTPSTITDLPYYISTWHINTADLVVSDTSNHASELAYIKSLNLHPRIDIEMVIWAGGQIQDPISDYGSYLAGLAAAGWPNVCSEGGRPGDATYIRSKGLGYVNYNCDQCGLWSAGAHTDPGTVLNLWECYYPAEVQYILQGAASGKPNGVLGGAWNDSLGYAKAKGIPEALANVQKKGDLPKGDNDILYNSLNGLSPSFQSIINSLISGGHTVTDFEPWGGLNSSKAQMSAVGFSTVVANLQKTFPPIGTTPVPTPTPTRPAITSNTAICSRDNKTIDVFVVRADEALWHHHIDGVTNTWDSLGGICKSSPAAVSLTPGTIDAFVVGSDQAIWHRRWSGTAWSAWNSLGGIVKTGFAPDTTVMNSCIILSVIGTNDDIYFKTSSDGTNWSGWVNESA